MTAIWIQQHKFENAQQRVLASDKKFSSKAITLAQKFYQKCIAVDEERKTSRNSGIKYVMEKIREFGIFPMLSDTAYDEEKFNASFDFTWLLAYFNHNRTVLHTIAPRIVFNNRMSRAVISFYPSKSLFAFLSVNYSTKTRDHFTDFLLLLMKRIAGDMGIDYDKTNAPPDILALVEFTDELHKIPVPDLKELLSSAGNDYFNMRSFKNLSDVERTVYRVNWTEYFLLVAPAKVHDFILSDPPVSLPPGDYIKRMSDLVSSTSPRTLTNYVIVQYILSWLPMLGTRYYSLVQDFASKIDTFPGRRRNDLCFVETNRRFPVAVMAMYARSGDVSKALIEGKVTEILKGLKDEINENEWMDHEFKKVVLQKLDKMKWSLVDDEMFHDDTAVDAEYADYLQHTSLADLSFFRMLEKISRVEKTAKSIRLVVPFGKHDHGTFGSTGYGVNAFYLPTLNRIMVPLPFLEFPFYESSFPRSVIFGRIGHVIGHEISHSLDTSGRMFDGDGIHRVWWRNDWVKQYDEKANCFADLYSSVKIPKFNLALNGSASITENIADYEGLKITYRAYKQHMANNSVPDLASMEGFTNDQLLFLAFSLNSCTKTSDLTLYSSLNSLHAPGIYRVNTVLSNFPPFAEAFFCSPKAEMNKGKKCSLW